MQSDPLGLAAGANTYNYVGGNPLNGIDPLGLMKKDKNGNLLFRSSPDLKAINGGHFDINPSMISEISGLKGYYIEGYLFTDAGNPIHASKFVFEDTNNPKKKKSDDYSYDCHGLTFTSGQYWINNTEVHTILKDEYKEISENEIKNGDIGVRYIDNKVVHSITVGTNSLNMFIAIEKNGYNSAWNVRPLFTISSLKYYRYK